MKIPYIAALLLLSCLLSVSFSATAQDVAYYNKLAKQEYENKRYYNAVDYATRSLNISSNGEAYWWRGMGRYYLNNFSDAAGDFGNAISYYASDRSSLASLYSWRGDCRFAQKQFDEAISDYEMSLSYGSENKLHIYWNQAASYYGKGDFKKAEELYTTSISYASKTEDFAKLYKYRGDARGLLYNYDEAIADFTKAIEYDPGFVNAFWQRGYYRSKKVLYELAIGDYTAAIRLSGPGTATTSKDLSILYNNRGLQYYNLKQYTSALADLGESLKQNPGYDYANWNMGRTLAALHRYTEAASYYLMGASMMQRDNDRASCYADLYWTDRAMLDYGQALVHIREAIRLDPDVRRYQWNLATLLAIRKEYTWALVEYDKTVARYSADSLSLVSIFRERGKLKNRMNDKAGALKDLHQAAQMSIFLYEPFYDLGRFYKESMKQPELASLNLAKAAEVATFFDTTVSYAYVKAVKGDKAEAVRVIEKILQEEAGNPDRLKWELYNAACIYVLMDNPIKGMLYLDKALATGFDDFDHMYNDYDLDPLRPLAAFRALLLKYKVPAPKFR